ncbi:MAG: hypothetical protein QF567_02945 [Candidatus Pacearchaeota archaeon]|jgi:ATP-dependent 26S proteasome regulatory subunit|nr:hypothetical protein [Candidatus Pacearchaeota archaeon]
MKQIRRIGGWQCWIDFYEDYVIKTPKTKEEIEENVSRYLRSINKIERLEKIVKTMLNDIKKSTKIINSSKIPKRLLGDVEFLEKGKVKQKRAIVLSEALTNSSNEAKELIKKTTSFLIELWKYGIHEKTFKIWSNYGVLDKRIILIDLFELTNNKEKVKKQIQKRKWNRPEKFRKILSEKLTNYFINELDKKLTIKNLNKYWNKNN